MFQAPGQKCVNGLRQNTPGDLSLIEIYKHPGKSHGLNLLLERVAPRTQVVRKLLTLVDTIRVEKSENNILL